MLTNLYQNPMCSYISNDKVLFFVFDVLMVLTLNPNHNGVRSSFGLFLEDSHEKMFFFMYSAVTINLQKKEFLSPTIKN